MRVSPSAMERVGGSIWILGAFVALNGIKNRTHFFRISVILTVLTVAVVLRQVLEPVNKSEGLIVTSVEFASYNMQLLTTFCCLIMTNVKTESVEDFTTGVTLLDKKMAAMGFPVDYRGTTRLIRILTGFLIFKTMVQQVPFCFKGSWTTINYLDYIAYNISLLIIHFLLLQWMVYLAVLRLHFKTLNSILKTLKQQKCWMIEDFRRKHRSRDSTLRKCGAIYDNLCGQAKTLNSAFSWQLLFLIPTVFILIIFNTFQTCRMIKKLTNFDSVWVIFGVLHLIMFLELVLPCITVQKESNKFTNILHKIGGTEIDDAVNSLILQTQHQTIEFSACGVFPLDGSLIYTVLGSLTTYLVILIQFDL